MHTTGAARMEGIVELGQAARSVYDVQTLEERRLKKHIQKGKRSGKKAVMGFAGGFRCLFEGIRFAYVRHGSRLAKFYLPPMLIGLVIMVVGWNLFYRFNDDIVALFWAEPLAEDWDWEWVWWLVHAGWQIVHFLLFVILAAATVVISLLLFMLMAAPFNDIMSEQVEGILGTWEPRPFSVGFLLRDLGHTILLELARLGIKAAWLLPLLVLSYVIPVVGQIFYIVFGGYLLAKFLGMDYVDWTLARRGYTWRERFRFAKQNRMALVGFGTAMILILFIPLGFVAVWPGAVAGGTILCTRLGPEDRRGSEGR